MAYITAAGLFQFLGILCGLVSILLESYAFLTDYRWNSLMETYNRNLSMTNSEGNLTWKISSICKSITKDTQDMTRNMTRRPQGKGNSVPKKLFFPSHTLNKLKESDISRDQNAEQIYLTINTLITLASCIHLLLCCMSRKIIYRTKYNAILHGTAVFLLALGAVLLTTSKYTIETGFVKIAKQTLDCDQFMICIHTPETEAHEWYFKIMNTTNRRIVHPTAKFKSVACQQSNLKSAAAIVNLIYIFLCGCILCNAMTVVIEYGDEEYIKEEQQQESEFNQNQRLSFSESSKNRVYEIQTMTTNSPDKTMSVRAITANTSVSAPKLNPPPIVPLRGRKSLRLAKY